MNELYKISNDNREMFEVFCYLHPHEAYELNPKEFMKYMKKEYPTLEDDTIIQLIKSTDK